MEQKDYESKLLYYKKRKLAIRNNLLFNFNFIIQLLDTILRNAFVENPNKYPDYFKNRHLYGILVYQLEQNQERQYLDQNNDEIEIMNGIYTPTEECDVFIKENERWMNMYKINTIQFCRDFAHYVMKGDNPNIPLSGGLGLSNTDAQLNINTASNPNDEPKEPPHPDVALISSTLVKPSTSDSR